MDIKFTKLQGLGNDFLVVVAEEVAGRDLGALARAMCERHYGAGADGVIVAAPGSVRADWSSRIFNADGSEAEVSGNGTRCLAAWVDLRGAWPDGDVLSVATAAGVKRVRRITPRGLYEMEMGTPRLASAEVPMRLPEPLARVVSYPVEAAGRRVEVTATSMGNPHCSVLVDDLAAVDFRRLGEALERHPLFPERTNVEFVQPLAPDRLRVLFWERGVGETLASGTGASAAAVAGALNGRSGRDVTVETGSGELRVTWRDDDVVMLTGPAVAVYEGRWPGRS